ncbi:propanediol utilization microcompartment protein PduB [Pediococcus claussenii]|uniref:Propanediol utilization protein PduB n=1 Tax=Pediococcus claussenii (strain ATCC BAA-344 / DSM 14800 / JCM 18046 / KCTC 3811 / LMG 21948 / P06) TaxID=701521 RepID=G8PEK0_PEDCP|nr:propanediol utilization microcompartment protein PduB [Pediococcus claussenii]AEV95609.1 Propanediol utilization protein PduB [Pediococcus claussenii ATCC BAA-344]ANZ69129.1 microcompartment protein PduB [Pediococcus claussenii]ANZ70946.1 microcompartment protein PduB [Pediococcus claussenii]
MNNFLNSTSVVPEFVGSTELGDTIGMCIPAVDAMLLDKLQVSTKKYSVIGILSSRTGAGPQILAMDEAVKATNTEVLDVEWPRDTKGGAGHGVLILIGGNDPSDVRQAISVALENLPRTFGDIYNSPAGHLELQFTASAAGAVHMAFGAPIGKAYGLICGAPSGIGVVMADTAIKTAGVEVIKFASPSHGTSFSNEGALHISGDSGAVRQAVIAGREVGLKLLGQLGGVEPKNDFPAYIK